MKSSQPAMVNVAIFPNCRVKQRGRNVPLREVLDGIRFGRWARPIASLRALEYGSKAYTNRKKQLPCFMVSASSATGDHKASDVGTHTGLLQIDVDDLTEESACSLRDRLGKDPHVLAAWLSPSGKGVKAALCIPVSVEGHQRAFLVAQVYVRENYGVEMDRHCSDPCRLCFVSHDPDLLFNHRAKSLLIAVESEIQPQSSPTPTPNSSTILRPPSPSYLLHNSATPFEQFPNLRRFYLRHVVKAIGKPQRGTRNDAICEIASRLFFFLHPRHILAFVGQFHSENADIMADYPLEDCLKEAQAIIVGSEDSLIRKELSATEARIYSKLEDDYERCSFRICRSLACCTSMAEFPPPLFCLSADELGDRLGKLPMHAWRILKRFEQGGIIKLERLGTLRQKGRDGKATVYRWIPSKEES